MTDTLSDEPTFILRASDPAAPNLVRNWALRLESEIRCGAKSEEHKARVAAALELANEMEAWRKGQTNVHG